jgi:dTMP kinase
MKKRGLLITFEGIDGSGKTTQLKMTAAFLRKQGYRFLILREPGSTPIAEQIRKILLGKENSISPASELLLYLAARADLVQKVIAPALTGGVIVLCDRFYDSTMAYQGYGRGLDISLIERLNDLTVGKVRPDLTFLVDVDYQTSLQRRKRDSDRLESESKAFFDRVRGGFLALARKEKERMVILDGKKPAADIFAEVENCLRKKLNIR